MKFGLQFQQVSPANESGEASVASNSDDEEDAAPVTAKKAKPADKSAQVVTLDQFRKK